MRWWLAVVVAAMGCGRLNFDLGPLDGGVADASTPTPDALGGPDALVCPSPFETSAYGCHVFLATAMGWAAAEAACEELGGHLAVLDHDGEAVYLRSTYGGGWIGAQDQVAEGEFVWITGEPVLVFWATDEPNNALGVEDCVELIDDASVFVDYVVGQSNDDDCSRLRPVLCEYDGRLPVAPTCDTTTATSCGECGHDCGAASCVYGRCADPADVCQPSAELACDSTFRWNLDWGDGTTTEIDSYLCSGLAQYRGPELAHIVRAEAAIVARATLSGMLGADLDLLLLDGDAACAASNCLDQADTELEFVVEAGATRFLLVDTDVTGDAPYRLDLACQTCDPPYVLSSTGCHHYVTTEATWHEAEAACEAEGGHLAVPSSSSESLAFVTTLATLTTGPWIGASDLADEGVFRWVTDEDASASWALAQPDDSGGEDCVELRLDGHNDRPCDNLRPYVCERDARPVTATLCDTDADASCGECGVICSGPTHCVSQICQ